MSPTRPFPAAGTFALAAVLLSACAERTYIARSLVRADGGSGGSGCTIRTLDFASDPTAIDSDDDGMDDWFAWLGDESGPTTILPEELAGGIWTVESDLLRSMPFEDFEGVTTIAATLRDRDGASPAGGAAVWLNVRARDGQFGPVYAQVTRTAAGTQDVALLWHNAFATPTVLGVVGGFPGGMIRIRMIVDQVTETVSLSADGVPIATTSYAGLPTMATETRCLSLASFDTISEFAAVSMQRCRPGL